jgi:hypothetical protein
VSDTPGAQAESSPASGGTNAERPEVAVAGAFAGGLLLALLVRKIRS